jgi:hypothetical protein
MDKVKYSFEVSEGGNTSAYTFTTDGFVTYACVAEQFLAFLSAKYGYTITPQMLVDSLGEE